MKKIIFYTSVSGLLVSIIIFCLSFAGFYFTDNKPFMLSIVIPMGLVMLGTFYTMAQVENNRRGGLLNQGKMGIVEKFTLVFANAPAWMKVLTVCGFIYMGCILIILKMQGSAVLFNGGGHSEYKINEARILVYPLLITIYAYAAAMFYPAKK